MKSLPSGRLFYFRVSHLKNNLTLFFGFRLLFGRLEEKIMFSPQTLNALIFMGNLLRYGIYGFPPLVILLQRFHEGFSWFQDRWHELGA